MPELPEAETIARGLDTLIRGRRLLGARSLTKGICERLSKYPVDARVSGVSRRGKKVLVHFDDGTALLVSLGMSGQLRRRPNGPLPKHTHMVLRFEGLDLLYVDPRRLGRLTPSRVATTMFAPDREVARWCDGRLGLDALDVSWAEFRARLALRRGAFKPLLLNQRVIAGVGNIYADEALFLARLHPLRAAGSIGPREARRLRAAVLETLQAANLGYYWIAIAQYLMIAAGVIFFVFYAKASIED